MKALLWMIIFSCLAVTVLSGPEEIQKLKDNRKKAVDECRKENPEVSEDDFKAVNSINPPQNEIQHCMINCVYEKMGVVKDGKLNIEEIDRIMFLKTGHDQAIFSVVDANSKACQSEVQQNYGSIKKCEVANEFHSCMIRKMSQMEKKP